MSDFTTLLSLPFIQAAQAQKHVTHNEALELLDLLVQLTLQDFAQDTPPTSPVEGQTWGIGSSPTGAWAGLAGQLASWRGNGWIYVTPQEGWQAWGVSVSEMRVYTGGAWTPSMLSFDNLSGVGVNATTDATNRLSVASPATLLNHDGSGHQLKINKAASGDTGSLLFQSNWTGHAEMGLAGNDRFAIKVTDGTNPWFTALDIDATAKRVTLSDIVQVPPSTTPASPTAGDVYFDSTTSKLRCYDGSVWQDLF